MKAIIVARVSTEEQREANNSLPAQLARMESYCQKKGLEIIERFSFDESAYKTKRDDFDKILNYINNTKEKIAICFDKVDRLSRNVFDKRVSTLYELAVADKIELHFVSDSQVINNQISAVEKFHFGMSLGLAKYYSDAISDNVKRTFEKMRREGRRIGKPPLGYIYSTDTEGNKTMIPDPERAHIIIRLFELYAAGNYSLDSLLAEATKMGLTSINGLPLPRSTLARTLRDPFYCGMNMSKKRGLYAHKYPRLITKELFDKCQEVLDGKRTNRPKFIGQEYIFKGLLTCPNCGCTYTPEIHKKPSGLVFIYYSCSNAKGICKRTYVSEKALLRPVYKILERFESISEDIQQELVDELRKTTEAEVIFHKAQINRIRSEYERIKRLDDKLLEAYLEESITKDIYDKKHQEYQDKLQLLNIELEEHTKADYDFQTTVATVFSVARRAKEIFESSEPAEKRMFLNYLLQNPTVKAKNLEFTLRSPFNLVLELSGSPIKGGYRDSNPS